MSAVLDRPTVTLDASALAARLSLAMVRPDHCFSPVEANTKAVSSCWIIGDKALVSLGGGTIQILDAFKVTCGTDLGWMLLKQANAETSPLYVARMFGMAGPIDKLTIKSPASFLQKCVMINRVAGSDIPHMLRINYQRDARGSVIVFDTSEAAFKSELGEAYKYVISGSVFRHCIRFEDGCVLE